MLLTRAPVAGINEQAHLPAAPRLACVKPVASVHPEPGSNSPLLVLFILLIDLQFCCSTGSGFLLRSPPGTRPVNDLLRIDKELVCSLALLYYFLSIVSFSMSFAFSVALSVIPESECKVTPPFPFYQIFGSLFFYTFLNILSPKPYKPNY